MKTVRWHLCLSIILLVIFQVSTGVHNSAADDSPMDEYSDVENQREHLLDIQKYTRFNYRAKKKGHGRRGSKRKYRDDNGDDDENKNCSICGLPIDERSGRVINGDLVKPLYKYPFLVHLLEMNQPVCAGPIISKKFVLTAAHCVENEKFPNITRCQRQRKLKECYLEASWFLVKFPGKQHHGRTMKIKRIIPHQSFGYQTLVYDIALLELEKPLKCTRKTSPICLPTKEMYKTGQKLYVAGWGENKPEGTPPWHDLLLREGVMKEVDAKYCMRPQLPEDLIKQYHCAVGTNQSSCYGDSGSTNFIKNEGKFYALGITSHGSSDTCSPTWPVTYAKVLYFKKWIKKHVKDLPKP